LAILAILAACNGHICEQTPMPSNQTENHKCIKALTPVLGLHQANQTCTFFAPPAFIQQN
ncbi:MAG: hypothetical protein WBE34_10295, partial [Candidatus Nitrosopolaris sp.]